jgi:hypothetical protein
MSNDNCPFGPNAERVADVTARLERLCTLVETDHKQTHARLKRLEAHLYGNPEAGIPGVVVDLDRVKGAASRAARLQWLVTTIVVGFIIERILSMI